MKAFHRLLLVMIFIISASGFAQKQRRTETVVIKTAIYCDHCKACETCGPKFEKELVREKGIQMVTLDEKAMTIKVVYNTNKTSAAEIRNAIAKLGYDADEVKADPLAYEALDGCCKK